MSQAEISPSLSKIDRPKFEEFADKCVDQHRGPLFSDYISFGKKFETYQGIEAKFTSSYCKLHHNEAKFSKGFFAKFFYFGYQILNNVRKCHIFSM